MQNSETTLPPITVEEGREKSKEKRIEVLKAMVWGGLVLKATLSTTWNLPEMDQEMLERLKLEFDAEVGRDMCYDQALRELSAYYKDKEVVLNSCQTLEKVGEARQVYGFVDAGIVMQTFDVKNSDNNTFPVPGTENSLE